MSVLDTDWPTDTLGLYGLYTQAQEPAAGVEYMACELVAQRNELLVHRIVATCLVGASAGGVGQGVHVLTPLQGYNPTVNGTTIWFPWAQTPYEVGQAAALPEAYGLGGTNAAQQIVNINGVPFTSIGPVHFQEYATGLTMPQSFNMELWGFQDPPIRVRPQTHLAVQSIAVATAGGALETLNVNWWFSEREAQE